MPAFDLSRQAEALRAHWQSAAVASAMELGVFAALERRARTAPELARALRADTSAIRTLCDALVSMGLLAARGGRYRAVSGTTRVQHLGARADATLPRFFTSPPMEKVFAGLADVVRHGPSATGAATRVSLWTAFAKDASSLRRQLAEDIAAALIDRRLARGRILDIGSGASPLGIMLLQQAPTASLVAVDHAGVVGLARRQASAAGVGDRLTTRAGDALVIDWAGKFDLVLMVNVLDYFTAADQARLVRKARAALRPGGFLMVAAPMLDEGRRSPPDAVAYSLLLLALESRGQASTTSEMRRRLGRARFGAVTRVASPSMLLARR